MSPVLIIFVALLVGLFVVISLLPLFSGVQEAEMLVHLHD